MRLFIVRHGESQDDIEDCYGGVADFPLTEAGRRQAQEAAEKLRSEGAGLVFSSPLARARETAEIIAASLGSEPVVVVDDLQERNTYGVLSGVNKKRAEQIFSRVLSQLKEKPGYSKETILGGEEYEAFVSRVRRALNWVLSETSSRHASSAVVVTHGKFTQALFERVFAIQGGVQPQLGAINVVDHQPARTEWVGQV